MKSIWFYRPGAAMRFPGKTRKERATQEQHRDATYYLWVAIPAKLGLLGALIYMVITGDSTGMRWFFYTIWMPVSLTAVILITPFIYGLWRSIKVFALMAIIIGLCGLAIWTFSH